MPRDDSLDALLQRAQDGDLRAFESLLAAYLPQVRRFARAFASAPADADDLAQDALLKVFKRIQSFRYQSSFSTWLFAVVRNSFLDAAKGSRGQQRRGETSIDEMAERAGDAPGADEALAREEERRRLWAALREVPPEFRSALVLFDIEGHSYDELAAIEGVPVGTVKSRLFRGRALLRKLLGERDSEEATGTSAAGASSKASGRGS